MPSQYSTSLTPLAEMISSDHNAAEISHDVKFEIDLVGLYTQHLFYTTVLHICSAHIMHRISYNLEKKFEIDRRLKRIIMHAFGSMVIVDI